MKINKVLLLALLGIFLCTKAVSAQSIVDLIKNSASIDKVIKDNVGFGRVDTKSQVNDSREKNTKKTTNQQNIEEEKEILNNNITAETKLKKTRIEEDYYKRLISVFFGGNQDVTKEFVTQFGYDLFLNKGDRTNNFGSIFNSISDDYVLGVGDEIVLTLRGQKNVTETSKVDLEGKIYLQNFTPFVVLGRSFGDVKNQIEDLVSENFIETEVFVSLGQIKDVSVVIAGEVSNAGVYTLSGVANLFDALLRSGGVKKTGSLRNIEIIRRGNSRKIDLYNLLLGRGDVKDVVLADGDRIVVPTIGRTVAVLGEVNRSAIYEIKGDSIDAEELISYAGGTLRTAGYRYISLSENNEGVDIVLEKTAPRYAMKPNDILIVLRSRDSQSGGVSLEGHVNVAGVRSMISAPYLSSIINGIEIFRDNPYLLFGAIQRRDKNTLARYFVPVDFSAVLNGREDIALEDDDKIIVFSKKDIEWLSSADVQTVLNKKVPPSVLKLLPDMSSADLSSLSSIEAVGDVFGSSSSGKDYKIDNTTRNKTEYVKAWSNPSICSGLRQLASAVSSSWTDRFVAAIHTKSEHGTGMIEDIRACPEVFNEYPDLLPFVLSNVVNINGEVGIAGIYPIAIKMPLSSIVSVSGGLTRNADLTSIEITRFSGSADSSSRETVNATQRPLSEVLVSSGDSIRFNQSFTDRELGNILLVGEFRRPGSYSIKKGEKLSDVITRAGGVTDDAYTIGAIFTRESVRQEEYKMIEVAVSNMKSGFMHSMASMKIDVSPAAVVAMMSELRNLMADTEPLGRIVVEADPLRLQIKPELDIVLQPGDKIYMPKRPNHILVSGEVLHGGAMQFISGMSPREYVKQAGGTTKSADKSRTFIVLPNGTAKPISISAWNLVPVNIPPGSTILIPRDTAPLNMMTFTKDILDIISKAAVTAASIKVLNRR